MAKSLIERVNTINSPPATKGVGYSDISNFFGGGYDSGNRDLTRSEYGAAQASQVLVDISASLNVWEQWLDGITWHIKDANTGDTIITTDQRVIPDGEKGARLFNAIKGFRTRYRHSYWKSLAISDWVTGETYIRRVRNQSCIPTTLQWMNPLATEPLIYNGKIQRYQYSNDDSSDVAYIIPEADIAYRMMRRNLFDDLRGLSPVLSIIDEANLSRNVKRAFRQYFRNGMILGGIISPSQEDGLYSPREISALEDMLQRNHRGVGNAHSWIISPRKVFAEAFEGKNTSNDIAILKDLGVSIKTAMGVDDVVIGNSNDVTYENLEAGINGWYRLKGIPYAKDIAEYHNNQIVPFIEPDSGVYLEPELSKYEIERPEVVSQDVTASVISLYDAQRKRGHQEANDKLKDIYMVNGRPMSVDVIVKLANMMPSDEIEQLASAEESIANAEAKPVESADGEVISDTPTGVQYDENGTAIPREEVFGYHIESGIVDINEARAQLGLPPIQKEDANDTDLVQLNSQLQTVITAINAGMGVDEAYESVGLEPPKQEPANDVLKKSYHIWQKSLADGTPISEPPLDGATYGGIHDGIDDGVEMVHFSHGNYDHTITDSKAYDHDKALGELKAWRKFRKSNPSRNFEPEYTLGDIADGIRARIADNADLESVFDDAFDTVKGWQKAIQATRLDYEGDFEELLSRAQASNNFGRVQWSSAVRKINRSYSRKAFIDGLADGGVTDGVLSDDDELVLQEHIREQSQYVTNLGKTLFTDDGKVVTEQMALQKPAMWYNKSINPAYQLGLLSADKNGMYEWALGEAEHCSDCKRLNGQRHRMKDWTRKGLLPKSDLLECGGFNCKCTLNKVNAKARGSY